MVRLGSTSRQKPVELGVAMDLAAVELDVVPSVLDEVVGLGEAGRGK